jgi:serine/threonine protein kinase
VLSSLRLAGIEVPEVYSTFEVQSHYYLVTEFIRGRTLHSVLLNQKKRLPISEALMNGLHLAELLKRIHGAGWVWRDCKPLNLILSDEGMLRPVDFEGACPVEKPDVTGWGTEGYTPPEWLKDATSRIPQDLFALGATLHQLLSGRLPDRNEPPPIGRLRRNVPLPVRQTISALLDSDPLSRPDAATVVQVLESVCSEIN